MNMYMTQLCKMSLNHEPPKSSKNLWAVLKDFGGFRANSKSAQLIATHAMREGCGLDPVLFMLSHA